MDQNLLTKVQSQQQFKANNETKPVVHNTSCSIDGCKNDNENITLSPKIKNHIFVCPDIRGRLGNWMFIFAASVGIAHTLNYTLVIKSSHPLLKYFELKEQVVNGRVDNVLAIKERQWRNVLWRTSKTYISYNLTLDGYYQSWKYFENVSKEIRESFEIKAKFRNQAMAFIKRNTPENKTLIGIHVRRGDFMTKLAMNQGRVVADKLFIQKAMEFFRKAYQTPYFVVVSDDKKWCKDNIRGNNVAFSEFKEPIIDMAIMSLSDHAITTSGSFSWWGGWLSGGTVIYLKDSPKPGSPLDRKSIDRGEYNRPEWIGMSNG